MRQNFYRFK